jgi:hypothetical protein
VNVAHSLESISLLLVAQDGTQNIQRMMSVVALAVFGITQMFGA